MESRVHVAASLRKLSTFLDNSGDQSRTFQEVGDEVPVFFPSRSFVFLLLLIFYVSHFGNPEIRFFLSVSWDKEKISVANNLYIRP